VTTWEEVDQQWSERYAADKRAWERERDELTAEVERLRDLLARNTDAGITIAEQRDAARAEVERLRGLLAEAIDKWESVDDEGTRGEDPTDRILEIRREAGLT
jgi:predicted nuclease with TOPRIM domain